MSQYVTLVIKGSTWDFVYLLYVIDVNPYEMLQYKD
jgi:hypothetical protein